MKGTRLFSKRAVLLVALGMFMALCVTPATAAAKTYPARIKRSSGSTFTRRLHDGQRLGKLPAVQKKGRSYSGYFARYGGSDRVFKVTKNTKIHFHGANKVLYVGPRLKVKLNFSEQGGSTVKNGRYGYLSKLPQPKRAGYVFEGWYTKRDGEGSYIGLSRMNRNLVKSRTVYADWDKIEKNDVGITLSVGGSTNWLNEQTSEKVTAQINSILGTRYDCDDSFYTYDKVTDITMHTTPTTAKKSWNAQYFTDTGSLTIAKHPTKTDVQGSSSDIKLPLASGDIVLLTCKASVGTHVDIEHYLIVRK